MYDPESVRKYEDQRKQEADLLLAPAREIENKSEFAVPLSEESVDKMVIIDGDIPLVWWVSKVYAVDFEGDVFVVEKGDGSPLWDFVPASRLWDRDRVIDSLAELHASEVAQSIRDILDPN